MNGERFCSVTRPKKMKFGRDQKVEFEKSFQLDRQILIKVLTKFGINFVHFAWSKVNEKKPRVYIMLKRPLFLPTFQIEEIFHEVFAD
jgi:hypothetical protein